MDVIGQEQDSSISINDLKKFINRQTMKQTNNAVSYHRYLRALDGIMKNTIQAKSMLKNKFELLQNEIKDIFGKMFCEQISETVKAHKQSKELLASAVFKDTASVKQLIGKAPTK